MLNETWSQNLDKVLTLSADVENDEEFDSDALDTFSSANDKLADVKANAHPKTQKAGVMRGSGPPGGSGRRPGGNRQSGY